MPTTQIVDGDTAKPIRAPLRDEDGDAPLLGASVLFCMDRQGGGKHVEFPAVIEDEAPWVAYWPEAEHVDTPGVYQAQFIVTFGNGRQETFPSGDPLIVVIRRLL